jgi:hypothetical protein
MRLVAVLNKEAHKFPFSVTNSIGVHDGCWAFCEIENVPLGPILHWRDATRNDIDTTPEGTQHSNGTKGFGLTVRSISPGTRVLVEVGK